MSGDRSPGVGHLWMLTGFGVAALAGKTMLESFARMHRAGQPARLMAGAAPFAMAGWMFSQLGQRTVEIKSGPATPEVTPPEPVRRRLRVVEPVDEAELTPAAEIPVVVPAPVAEVLETAAAMADAAMPVPDFSEPEAVASPEAVAEPEAVAAGSEPVAEPEAVAAEPEPVAEPEAALFVAERPTALADARARGADDLKRIKGVGPKLEKVLNGLGYFHFDQIAAWDAAELELVDGALEGFSGRATRDDWIGQAAELARETLH